MNIEHIWNNTNISSLILLKLFDDICVDCFSVQDKRLRVPIHYMCYDYGLLDCYLNDKNLALVFDKETCLSDLRKTTSKYYSFIDRLQDSKHYHSILTRKSLIVVFLKIPEIYHEDLELIKKSMYSQVSKLFKKKMLMDYTRINGSIDVPRSSHPIARYIVVNNIPGNIVRRTQDLIQKISEALRLDREAQSYVVEGYVKWNPDRETWDLSKLDKYV